MSNDWDDADDGEEPCPWDCRWPDPVAVQVANQRLLTTLDPARDDLNTRLPVSVTMEHPPGSMELPSAIVVSPWAVERVYWASPMQRGVDPPLYAAMPLEHNEQGRVKPGQGAVLDTGTGRTAPVVIAWEPETGHYFVETLLRQVSAFVSADEARRAALGLAKGRPPTMAAQMQRPVSRRSLFDVFRKTPS